MHVGWRRRPRRVLAIWGNVSLAGEAPQPSSSDSGNMGPDLIEHLQGQGTLTWDATTIEVRYCVDVYQKWIDDLRGGRVAGNRQIEASALGGDQVLLAQAAHAKAPLVLHLEDGLLEAPRFAGRCCSTCREEHASTVWVSHMALPALAPAPDDGHSRGTRLAHIAIGNVHMRETDSCVVCLSGRCGCRGTA